MLLYGLWACAALSAQPLGIDYDRSLPFAFEKQPMSPRRDVLIFGGSFQILEGRRMDCVLVEPVSTDGRKRPAIVFQHGGGQSMSNYIGEAALLAKAGAVSLIIEGPYRRNETDWTRSQREEQLRHATGLVIAARRAVDLLISRPDVDPGRIAFVGHSYGGNLGAVLAGVERRIGTFVLIGLTIRYTTHMQENQLPFWKDFRAGLKPGEMEQIVAALRPLDADQFLPQSAPAALLFQCARFDMDDVKRDCELAYNSAGRPKTLKWYEVEHAFADLEASLDRVAWLGRRLRLAPVPAVLRKRAADAVR